MLTPESADLTGLIKASHWCPTDFVFRCEWGGFGNEGAYMAELSWPEHRAILELWRLDDKPVPENPPDKSELYVEPDALTSPEKMTEILAECAALAAEAGAEQIPLPCPSEIEPAEGAVDVIDRQFAFAWLRKQL